jgi:5'-nucleotidase
MASTPLIAMQEPSAVAPERRLWCNRTLNLRSIRAIGYDMDYTLVHYRTEEWERAAFQHALVPLAQRGWPVQDLTFDPASVIQGLAFDLDLGNLVKATRFGYVIRAHHGTRVLSRSSGPPTPAPSWTFPSRAGSS